MSHVHQQARAGVGELGKFYTGQKNNYFRIGLSALMTFYLTMGLG